MKNKLLLTTLCLLGTFLSTYAQLTIPPADGSDGIFAPVANVEVDLSQAILNDAITYSNSGGNIGKGVYDKVRWVVVYKYSSVNIPAGVTVTFKNHPSYAPVVWLVQGSVSISGNVNLNGKSAVNGTPATVPAEPGPGGFRGGAADPILGIGYGLGPGGGVGGSAHGAYNAGTSAYGRVDNLPLIGGSGGAPRFNTISAGGGGGAILIATPGNIQFSGTSTISTIGGLGTDLNGNLGVTASSTGSGGAIRLVANTVTGTGALNSAATGRVRVEANSMPATIVTTPLTIAVPPNPTPTLFQSPTSPTCKILSVDSNAPADVDDPRANFVTSADIGINKTSQVAVVVETRNFVTAGARVTVRITGKYGSLFSSTEILTPNAGGTTAVSTWTLNTAIPQGYHMIQARATGQ